MQFAQLKRRDFIRLVGGAAAWPLAARGQQQVVHPLIGVLSPLSAASAARNMPGFDPACAISGIWKDAV